MISKPDISDKKEECSDPSILDTFLEICKKVGIVMKYSFPKFLVVIWESDSWDCEWIS